MKKRGEHVPEHMANCLYLEWFTDFGHGFVMDDFIMAKTL